MSNGSYSFIYFFLFLAKSKGVAHQAGNHQCFICVNYADRNPAGCRRNHVLIRCVSLCLEFDAKETQPIANPGADCGGILPNTTGEH